MSYTGSAAGTGFSNSSTASVPTAGRPHDGGLRPTGTPAAVPRARPESGGRTAGILETCHSTATWLLRRQAADGHWRGPLEGDTILESEYLLILAWTGTFAGPHVAGAVLRILRQQLPDGGWSIYRGGPIDISASVKAYFAL